MKWQIPTKTFLVGEYAALVGGPALILTSAPYFEVGLLNQEQVQNINPLSPAGLYWEKNHKPNTGLEFHDPFNGMGGLGASTAQFLGAYKAFCSLQQKEPDLNELMQAYYEYAYQGQGLKPSGYDLMAQYLGNCVYIHKNESITKTYPWVFDDLQFTIVHTGKKLATHEHLRQSEEISNTERLCEIAQNAKLAFDTANSGLLIEVVKQYHEALVQANCVADHTLDLLSDLNMIPEVLAAKGCGAMGADTVLILCKKKDHKSLLNQVKQTPCIY